MIVKTVVDTGAVITVISLKLLACTKFQMTAWEGPRIIMANGSTASLLGATLITVQLHNKIAKGKAVVMQMEGIDLLLGNDFLKQFGKLNIDYQDSQTLITVGELPLNLITPQKPEPGKSVKIQTTEGLNVPAFSVRQVPISQPSSLETQLFTPSRKLMIQKSLTVDTPCCLVGSQLSQLQICRAKTYGWTKVPLWGQVKVIQIKFSSVI
jgi:hypothetical protein